MFLFILFVRYLFGFLFVCLSLPAPTGTPTYLHVPKRTREFQEGIRNRTEPAEPNRTEPFYSEPKRTVHVQGPTRTEPKRYRTDLFGTTRS